MSDAGGPPASYLRIVRFGLSQTAQILTGKSSKFRTATRNLAKTEVLQEDRTYNFDVGQKLIRGLNLGKNHD